MISTIKNATYIENVVEQEAQPETDWISANQTTLSTQPTELNVDVTSTTTSLVSSSTLTQGQEVTLVESDNSYTDGVLGVSSNNITDVSSMTYDSKSYSSGDGYCSGLAISTDGTKMYSLHGVAQTIRQHTLSTPFDVSTASYTSTSPSLGHGNGRGIYIKSDGTEIYIARDTSVPTTYQYTMSTPWDITTMSLTSTLDASSEETAGYAQTFNNDGTKMYRAGIVNDTVYQYTLSTPWLLSSASYDSVFKSVGSEEATPIGITFNSYGTRMYILGATTTLDIMQYNLSTPWDVSTSVYSSESKVLSTEGANPYAFTFDTTGTRFYQIDYNTTFSIYQYSVNGSINGQYSADITSFSLATAPTKAFLKDDTSISLAIESTPERIVNEVSTHLTVLEDTTALLTDVDPFGDGSLLKKYQLADLTDTLGGASLTSDVGTLTYEAGKFGNSAVFNGASSVGTGETVTGAFSISLWFYINTQGANNAIFGNNDASGLNGFYLMVLDTASGALALTNVAAARIDCSTVITQDKWHHVVVTFDGTTNVDGVKIYLNNSVDGSGTPSSTTLGSSTDMKLGVRGLLNSVQLNGGMDQVEIYNRALTDSEINTLYTQGTVATDTTNLVVTEPIYEGEKLFIDDTEVTLGAVTGDADGANNTSTTDATETHSANAGTNGTVSASTEYQAGFEAYRAFNDDGIATSWTTSLGTTTGWLQYEFNIAKCINKYTIIGINAALARSPKDWTIEASNTGAFAGEEVILDTVTNEINWLTDETRVFTFNNGDSYTHYRIDITANNGDSQYLNIGEMELIEATNIYSVAHTLTATTPTKAYRKGSKALTVISQDGADNTSTTDSVPTMTSNTTPSGTASSSVGNANDYLVFDDVAYWDGIATSIAIGGYFQYTRDTGVVINKYMVRASNTVTRAIKDWTLRGSTDNFASVDDVLDTVVGEVSWGAGEERWFTFESTYSYTSHRLTATANNGDAIIEIDQIKLVVNPNASDAPTLTQIVATSPTSGLLTTGDTILLDNNKPVVTTSVVEGTALTGTVNNQFETVLYTGNSLDRTITATNITGNVDFAWVKSRSRTDSHVIVDSVRGAGADKSLNSNTTYAEDDVVQGYYGHLTGIGTTNGFTVAKGADAVNGWYWVNHSGEPYVAWCASLPNHTASNTDGTITSETKANDFMSAISFTGTGTVGQTVGHGLGSTPELFFVKGRAATSSWFTYNATSGATKYMKLDDTIAATTALGVWNNTEPTSSVITISDVFPASSHIAYAFTSVAGQCKVGSYTGTGASGNAVDCGFEPAWVMIKRTDGIGTWGIFDIARGDSSFRLEAQSSAAEIDGADVLLTPTGFNLTSADAYTNVSGGTYIYLAIAKDTSTSIPKYTCTIPAQDSAPTTVAVPDRTQKLTVTSKLFDGTKFNYTYNAYDKQGRAIQRKISSSEIGTELIVDGTTPFNTKMTKL